jgi:hypothetical protein
MITKNHHEALEKARGVSQLLLKDLQEVYQTDSDVAKEILIGEMIEQISRINTILKRLVNQI